MYIRNIDVFIQDYSNTSYEFNIFGYVEYICNAIPSYILVYSKHWHIGAYKSNYYKSSKS